MFMGGIMKGGVGHLQGKGQNLSEGSTRLCRFGGRGGIRTHGTVTRTPDFESGAFNHSATLPTIDIQALTQDMKPRILQFDTAI
jgi:hypothetical protein